MITILELIFSKKAVSTLKKHCTDIFSSSSELAIEAAAAAP